MIRSAWACWNFKHLFEIQVVVVSSHLERSLGDVLRDHVFAYEFLLVLVLELVIVLFPEALRQAVRIHLVPETIGCQHQLAIFRSDLQRLQLRLGGDLREVAQLLIILAEFQVRKFLILELQVSQGAGRHQHCLDLVRAMDVDQNVLL